MSSGSEKCLEVNAGVSGSIVGSFFFCVMEPPPKRPRHEDVQYEFVFQSTTPRGGRELYPPKLIQLILNSTEKLVVCDGSRPHGSWDMKENELIIFFHHNAVQKKIKDCVYQLIEGTHCWLQVECSSEWQSVLIPSSTGLFEPM